MNAISQPLGAPPSRAIHADPLAILWIALCVAFFVLGALGGVMMARVGTDTSLHDTYYVVAHIGWVVSVGVVLVLFAAFHLVTMTWLAGRYRRPLGWCHLALTALGVSLLSAPQVGLGLAPPARYVDYERSFSVWQTVSSAGYVALFLGGLIFAVLCIALFVPRKGVTA